MSSKTKISEYEAKRLQNLKDNELMLREIMNGLSMSDLMKGLKPRRTPSKKPRRSEPVVIRDRPVTRSRSSLGSEASSETSSLSGSRRSSRLSSRRSSVASSVAESASGDSPAKKGSLVVKFWNRKRKAAESDEDEDDGPSGKRSYGIYHDQRTADEITQEDLDMVAVSVADKTYDAIYGSTCHQCRQKTNDMKTICRSGLCFGVRGKFCGPCLRNRYGEDVKEALKDPNWCCPPCRDICNCSICRRRNGRSCTGILIYLAQENGFSNVKDYLFSIKRQYDKDGQKT